MITIDSSFDYFQICTSHIPEVKESNLLSTFLQKTNSNFFVSGIGDINLISRISIFIFIRPTIDSSLYQQKKYSKTKMKHWKCFKNDIWKKTWILYFYISSWRRLFHCFKTMLKRIYWQTLWIKWNRKKILTISYICVEDKLIINS